MSRARATTLALVNWKGVFFERYLLDQQVTALEGANGADFTGSMKEAWRSSLYRVNADGSLSRECAFVTRRMWFNLAI